MHKTPGRFANELTKSTYRCKNKYMKYILVLAFFLASCSPKIVTETKTVTKSDTVRIYETDTVLVPARVDTFALNLKSICDSLFEQRIEMQSDRGISVIIDVDSSGNASLTTSCDSLMLIIDSLKTTTTIVDTVIITNTTTIKPRKTRNNRFWRGFAFGAVSVLVLALMLFIRR